MAVVAGAAGRRIAEGVTVRVAFCVGDGSLALLWAEGIAEDQKVDGWRQRYAVNGREMADAESAIAATLQNPLPQIANCHVSFCSSQCNKCHNRNCLSIRGLAVANTKSLALWAR